MRLAYKKVDTSGRPLAGVEFSLINAATNVVTEVAASDENGEFIFRHIDYGDWIIRETCRAQWVQTHGGHAAAYRRGLRAA